MGPSNAAGLRNVFSAEWTRLHGCSRYSAIRCVEPYGVSVDLNPTAGWQAVQREGLRLTRVRGVPLASEALRFIESGRRQRLCNSVASLDSAPSVLTGHS